MFQPQTWDVASFAIFVAGMRSLSLNMAPYVDLLTLTSEWYINFFELHIDRVFGLPNNFPYEGMFHPRTRYLYMCSEVIMSMEKLPPDVRHCCC